MNVLNVADIERELRIVAARARHENAKRWVLTVARNHILGKLPEKDAQANFREVSLDQSKAADSAYYVPPIDATFPTWVYPAMARGDTVVWFDPIQVRRRDLWKVLDMIMLWINHWQPTDTRLRRIDRISFPVATQAAVLWHKNVSDNIWDYVVDKPVVVKEYDHGFRVVKLVSALQFEREGKLVSHCVGNGNYYNRWRTKGDADYFSLRDRNNQPHATLEVAYPNGNRKKGSVVQCKGKQNAKPVKQYQPYLRQFVLDMKFSIDGDVGNIDMGT